MLVSPSNLVIKPGLSKEGFINLLYRLRG